MFLELHALHRRQALVEQHQRGARGRQRVLQLFDLALAEVEVGRRRFDPLDGPADDLRAGGVGEPLQLLEMLVDLRDLGRAFARRADEVGALDGRLDLNQLADFELSKAGDMGSS
jgi:hypothetical protein